uniref:SREBP regulating gene protein n=1 Tax=Monodelphis domestica TaxID=13616 RepID=F7G1F5_MONDO
MVNLASMVWRRLLRKRWVLGLVFGLSLIYFLTSTFKQVSQSHPLLLVSFVSFGCKAPRGSHVGDGKDPGSASYVCERKDLLVNGCCNVNAASARRFWCDGCLANGCCGAYEYCVSCCLQPSKQLLLERFLNQAAAAFQNLFMAVEDHFELCLAKCRTSSQSVQHENTYRDPIAKYCYGENPPELFPA